MLRSLSFLRPCLPSITASANADHMRFQSKIFVRERDEMGYYYTRNKAGPNGRKPHASELFVFNDLVLELDAEHSKTVREFTDKDDTIMEKKWRFDPRRQQVSTWADSLEKEVNQSRHKLFEFSNRPVNSWKIGKHDIISLALRGIPTSEAEHSTQRSPHSTISFNSDDLESRAHYKNVSTMVLENVIPLYSVETDVELLNWLRLRHATMESGRRCNEKPPYPAQIMAEVARQTSIAGIRRVMKQSLDCGCEASSFEPSTKQLLRACDSVLEQSTARHSDHLELLRIYATLKEKFSSTSVSSEVQKNLCSRGLSLSAVCFKPEVTIEYLKFGFRHRVWSKGPGLDPILTTLTTYATHLRQNKSPSQAIPISQRQTLLQSLTGIGKGEEAPRESFRTIILAELQSHVEAESRCFMQLYLQYLLLLSNLGAFATLWKEYRRFHSIAQQRPEKQTGFIRAAEAMFANIILDTDISAIGHYSPTVAKNLDFAQCVILDYDAMEGRADFGPSGPHGETRNGISLYTLKSLELPLGVWLKELTRATSSSNGSLS